MKLIKLSFLVIVGIALITGCKKEEEIPLANKISNESNSNNARLGRTQKAYEWNGVGGDAMRCYDFRCSCADPRRVVGSTPEEEAILASERAEFITNVNNMTIKEWYLSGRGQEVLFLGPIQLKDVLDGVSTWKYFPDGGGAYHLVYVNATNINQRKSYPRY